MLKLIKGDKINKIYFIHNTAMWYRRPLFKLLSQKYDIKFIFTHIGVCKDIYGVEIGNKIEGLEGVDYEILKNHFPNNIAFGVINKSLKDYDVIIGISYNSLPELIETCLYLPIVKLRKKPIILYSEDFGGKTLSRKIITPLLKIFTMMSSAILVPGTKHKEYFISLGASPDKIFLFPNASNITIKESDHISKEKLIEKLKINDKKIVLYIGRLVERKGVQDLIRAFSKLIMERKDVDLIIVGRGEYGKKLESLCKNLNIMNYVHFMGYVEDEFLPAFYLMSNVCVVPSSVEDAWVLVLNEAMYFGKPVIATDNVGGAFDMIKDGVNGYVVPARDADVLCDAMKKILSDSNLEIKMGEKSKKIIEDGFTYEHMVKGFKNAIEYSLSNK